MTLKGSVFYSLCTHYCNSGELNPNPFFCVQGVWSAHWQLSSAPFSPTQSVEKLLKSRALGGSLVLSDVYWELHSGFSEKHLKFTLQRLFRILCLKVVYASLWKKKKRSDIQRGKGWWYDLSLKSSIAGSAQDSGWDSREGRMEGEVTVTLPWKELSNVAREGRRFAEWKSR